MINYLKTSLFYLLIFLSSGCKEELLHNLDETKANKIVLALFEEGIEIQKQKQKDGGWTLIGDHQDLILSIRKIEELKLLKTKSFKNESSLILNSKEENEYLENKKIEKIETTLNDLPGIVDAKVHINLYEEKLNFFLQKHEELKGTASVIIFAKNNFNFSNEEVIDIVSGASGIKKENINLIIKKSILDPNKDRYTQIDTISKIENKGLDEQNKHNFIDDLLNLKLFKKQSIQLLMSLLFLSIGILLTYKYASKRRVINKKKINKQNENSTVHSAYT